MNRELEKEFYSLRNFVIEDFVNLKIEKIIVCENLKSRSIVFVYIKIFENNWQKYFLDAGAGFWEDTKITDYNELEDIENDKNFVVNDYTEKIKNKVISKIYCEPNNENCRIIIELGTEERLILRCKDSKQFDSDCEIIIESD